MFTLPTGEFDLLLAKDGKEKWENVAITDFMDAGMIASTVEDWSKNYEVKAARFNGKNVPIPKNYHWVLRWHDEVYGTFKTRAEAMAEMNERKRISRIDKKTHIGMPYFVHD